MAVPMHNQPPNLTQFQALRRKNYSSSKYSKPVQSVSDPIDPLAPEEKQWSILSNSPVRKTKQPSAALKLSFMSTEQTFTQHLLKPVERNNRVKNFSMTQQRISVPQSEEMPTSA